MWKLRRNGTQREKPRPTGLPRARFDPTQDNVEAIARLEQEALLQRTIAERFSDVVTRTIGTAGFLVLHLLVFVVWVTINLGAIPIITPFDPFPFGILTLVLSGEGVLLAIFVLISQNRMSRQADRRAHLSLQVSMLAEQELTLLLQMQKLICDRLDIAPTSVDGAVSELMKPTDVDALVDELEHRLPHE